MAGIEAAGSFVLGDHSHDINLVKQNALKLARIAKAAGLPTVLTSSMEDRIQGPLVPELAEILPDEFAARIRRSDARSCSWPASQPRSASMRSNAVRGATYEQ